MAEGEGTTATAGAPAAGQAAQPGSSPAGAAGSPGNGAGAGQQAGSQQGDTVSIARGELDSLRSNAGRYQQLQRGGSLDFMGYLDGRQLTAQDVRDTLEYFGRDLPEGVTLKDVLTAIRTPSQARQQGRGQQAQGQQQQPYQDPDQRPMTVADWKRMQDEQTQQQRVSQAEHAAQKFWKDFQAELKVDGGPRAVAIRGLAKDAELQAIAEDIQKERPWLQPDAAMEMAGEFVPNAAQLARAKEIVANGWKDMANAIVSAAASGQAGLPAGTLGGGAGGSPPPPGKTAAMTAAERQQAMGGAIDDVFKKAGYKI